MGTGNEDVGNKDVGLKDVKSWIETFLQPPSLAPGTGPGISKATFSVDKKKSDHWAPGDNKEACVS